LDRGVRTDAGEDVRHGGPEHRLESPANSVALDARTRDDEGPPRAEPREELGQLGQSPGTIDQLGHGVGAGPETCDLPDHPPALLDVRGSATAPAYLAGERPPRGCSATSPRTFGRFTARRMIVSREVVNRPRPGVLLGTGDSTLPVGIRMD